MLQHLSKLFILGGLGVVLRYFIITVLNKYDSKIPFGIFIANILGCFLIGYCFQLFENETISKDTFALLSIALIGGLTTFSSLIFDFLNLIKNGQNKIALFYLLISIFVGLGAVLIGIKAGVKLG